MLFSRLIAQDDSHLEEEAEEIDLEIHPNSYVLDDPARSWVDVNQRRGSLIVVGGWEDEAALKAKTQSNGTGATAGTASAAKIVV